MFLGNSRQLAAKENIHDLLCANRLNFSSVSHRLRQNAGSPTFDCCFFFRSGCLFESSTFVQILRKGLRRKKVMIKTWKIWNSVCNWWINWLWRMKEVVHSRIRRFHQVSRKAPEEILKVLCYPHHLLCRPWIFLIDCLLLEVSWSFVDSKIQTSWSLLTQGSSLELGWLRNGNSCLSWSIHFQKIAKCVWVTWKYFGTDSIKGGDFTQTDTSQQRAIFGLVSEVQDIIRSRTSNWC